ncbi:MAG: hypothetical protein CSB49_03630 [Proteobacteria bacterium]|nr:MAG: hypothetical protein CSB49_03630 [Pseudomonadota bacterium]
MSRYSSISITAHYTAQAWVRQGLPWAEFFDTTQGRALHALCEVFFAAARRAGFSTPSEFLVQRHRIIDALVAEACPAQLIELGAGLSPRALAFADSSGGPALDIDLPAMVELKRQRLGGHAPPSYRALAVDLVAANDYTQALSPYLKPVSPTVVISEGLVAYFPLPRQQQIFDRVAALLRRLGGGRYITDIHHQQTVDRLGATARVFRTLLSLLSRNRQPLQIPNEAVGRRMIASAGFDELSIHDPQSFRSQLDLPNPERDSGLVVYEATIG